ERAQQGALAAAGRADDGGDAVAQDAAADVLHRGVLRVQDADVAQLEIDLVGRLPALAGGPGVGSVGAVAGRFLYGQGHHFNLRSVLLRMKMAVAFIRSSTASSTMMPA